MYSRVDSGSLKSSESIFLSVFENLRAQFWILKAWIPELKIMHKSCEFWNPNYFALRDHYIQSFKTVFLRSAFLVLTYQNTLIQ